MGGWHVSPQAGNADAVANAMNVALAKQTPLHPDRYAQEYALAGCTRAQTIPQCKSEWSTMVVRCLIMEVFVAPVGMIG